MQNSNSMWKLTALAGAVGLGLLVIMQAKQSLDKTSPKTVEAKGKSELKDFRPLADLDKLGAPGDITTDETPPKRRSAKQPAINDPFDAASPDLSLDEPDSVASAPTDRGRKPSRSSLKDLDDLDFDQSEPEPRPAKPSAELLLDETESDDSMVAESNDSSSDPFAESSSASEAAPKSSRRQMALKLLQSARQLIEDGNLDEARIKASEAADLEVAFGPLDDSPDEVLADIARLESTSTKPQPEPDSISLAGNRNRQVAPLDLDEPELPVRAKKKTSPLDDVDNMFADNPPEAPKGVKRIPDPPIPPAEEPGDDDSLNLPMLDDSDSTAKPVKSMPELSSVPNRLKSESAKEDRSETEGILGSGTLRADAPRGPQRPELKIEKVAPPNAVLGKSLVYTIVVRNVGEATAHQVVVEDQIPLGTSLSGTIPRAELTDKTLTWRMGSIPPGESKEIQVKVVPVAEGQIGSVATVSFHAEVASRTTVSAPKISLKLNAPQQVRLGETANLNFTITNNAAVEAAHVVLRNVIPDNLKLEGLSEKDLEYDVGTLPPGKSQTVQLPLATVRAGRAINKATVTMDGVTAAEAQAEINVVGNLISLTRHGPTNTFANKPLEFENRLTNNSLSATRNTVVVESLPKTVEFVSASDGGKFDPRLRTVTWQVAHLDPQQTLPLKVKLIAKTTGSHLGSVQVTEAGRRGAVTEYQIKTIGTANLSLEFLEKAEAYSRGEQFTLRLAVKNKGSGAATNVGLRIAIPNELQFVSMRGPINHTVSGRELVLEPINEIGGQGTVNLELTFRAVGTGDTALSVEMQSDQFKKSITQEEPLVIFNGSVN